MAEHHVGLVSDAREIAMLARSSNVSLDEATELIETYARAVAAEALAKNAAKVYDEILAKLAITANTPVTSTCICPSPTVATL
jgi:hypothetical protein